MIIMIEIYFKIKENKENKENKKYKHIFLKQIYI